jgi:TRAP-type transport system small permease protein
MKRLAGGVATVLKALGEAVNWIGYVSVSCIVLITSVDVVGRYCFNSPLLGSLEVLELCMAVLGGFAILYTTSRRGHISVDLFFVMFPRWLQIGVHSFGSILGFATWAIFAYETYELGKRSMMATESSSLLNIPLGPFQMVLAFSLALHSLVLLMQGLRPPEIKGPEKAAEELGI